MNDIAQYSQFDFDRLRSHVIMLVLCQSAYPFVWVKYCTHDITSARSPWTLTHLLIIAALGTVVCVKEILMRRLRDPRSPEYVRVKNKRIFMMSIIFGSLSLSLSFSVLFFLGLFAPMASSPGPLHSVMQGFLGLIPYGFVFLSDARRISERDLDIITDDQHFSSKTDESPDSTIKLRWVNSFRAYAFAWICHTLAVYLLYSAKNWMLWSPISPVPQSISEAATTWVVITTYLIMLIASFMLYRLTVYAFIYRSTDSWFPHKQHPYRPYLVGWSVYYLLTLSADMVTAFASGMLSIAWAEIVKVIVTYFIFWFVTSNVVHVEAEEHLNYGT